MKEIVTSKLYDAETMKEYSAPEEKKVKHGIDREDDKKKDD